MSNLEVGIVGLPNVGKSTLFNAITKAGAEAANYPFCTIEPNVGVVAVPDARLKVLTDLYHSKKTTPASVRFVDIAGLVKGASKGEGLGNKFLHNIRECDAIVHIVRAFENSDILRHDNSPINPQADIDVINTELILADIQTIEHCLPRLQKEAKANPKARQTATYLETLLTSLNSGIPIASIENIKYEIINDLHLLTAKPIIYTFNIDETGLSDHALQKKLAQLVAPAQALFICAKLEEELRELSSNDAAELLSSYGASETGLSRLIHAAYDTLGLQSYLTAGQKEVRAWTIHKGWTAPQASSIQILSADLSPPKSLATTTS